MTIASEIIELVRDQILASNGTLDLSDDSKILFASPLAGEITIPDADLPRVVIYAPFPKANEDNTVNTQSSIDFNISVYYRATESVFSLEQTQTDQDIASQLRSIVHAVQQAQIEDDSLPDCWLTSVIDQKISRNIVSPTETNVLPVITLITEFTLSFEEVL